jgi:hypothetical protein
MLYDEQTITYLAALYAELNEYRRRRKAIQALIDAGDDCDYYAIILKDWDYNIDLKQKQIAAEQQKESA